MSKYCIKTSSKEAILKAGSENTLGVFIDDPQNINSLSDVFVDFYFGCTKSTISRGTEEVHSTLFLTSNEVVSGTPRYGSTEISWKGTVCRFSATAKGPYDIHTSNFKRRQLADTFIIFRDKERNRQNQKLITHR